MPPPNQLLFVRPSTKLVQVRYVAAVLAAASGYLLRHFYPKLPQPVEFALYGIGGFWLITTIFRHIGLMFTSLASDGDKLTFEQGFLAKSTRSMNLSKIQDAKVDQSIGERMMGIGSLTLESAGESGRLVMENIDRPREVADQILNLSRHALRGGSASGQGSV
ncbi:MAG: PH domain-containing protein [Acidobacteria bacterium]|nr:PH domain-containing protein [Acidobacteriota bacterium]